MSPPPNETKERTVEAKRKTLKGRSTTVSFTSVLRAHLVHHRTRKHVQGSHGTRGEAGCPAGLRASGRPSECLTPVPTVTLKCHCPNDLPVAVTQLNTAGPLEHFDSICFGELCSDEDGKGPAAPLSGGQGVPCEAAVLGSRGGRRRRTPTRRCVLTALRNVLPANPGPGVLNKEAFKDGLKGIKIVLDFTAQRGLSGSGSQRESL